MAVMPDANLPKTLGAILGSAYGCAGQRCLAGSVLVAVGDIYEPLRDGLVERAAALKVGNGMDSSSQMGPVISKQALDRVCTYIERGQSEGANLLLDGRSVEVPDYPNGNFLGPTVFDQVQPGMSIATDEIFGPVLSAYEVRPIFSQHWTSSTAAATETLPRFSRKMVAMHVASVMKCAPGISASNARPHRLRLPVRRDEAIRSLAICTARGRDAINLSTDCKVVIERWF